MWPHTGAIFCGGQSRRMGRPKAGIILPDGLTMVEHVYKALKIVCRQVVLVGHGDGVPVKLNHLIRIPDQWINQGPLGGLEALLSSGIDSEYIIAPCDLPQAVGELFGLLIEDDADAKAVLMSQKSIEPMIGRYSTKILPLVRESLQQGKLSMRDLVFAVQPKLIEVPEDLCFALKNVNTEDDMKAQKKGNGQEIVTPLSSELNFPR